MSVIGQDYGVGNRRAGLDLVEVDDGNFDYNEKVLVETSQKHFRDYWIRPVGGVVNQEGPFIFMIEPMTDRYLQLNRACLEIKCKVVRQDGSDLGWNDIVAPVNLLGAVMWESVNVHLNGHPFKGASAINAGYKAIIETMLSYDSDARDTHLKAQFLELDSPYRYSDMHISQETIKRIFYEAITDNLVTPPQFPQEYLPYDYKAGDEIPVPTPLELANLQTVDEDDELLPMVKGQEELVDYRERAKQLSELQKRKKVVDLYRQYFIEKVVTMGQWKTVMAAGGNPTNIGYENRFGVVRRSAPFDMYVPITHDFFKLNNHIGPGNRIEIRLAMYPHSFLLNTYLDVFNYKLQILDMKLHLRTIERREKIPIPLKETYQMSETQLHRQIVGQGLPSITFRIHNGGVMPKTIIVAMVTTKAAEGSYSYNPFYFHHFDCERMALVINGETYPTDGLHFDFGATNPLVSRAYKWMYENTGASEGDKGNIVHWSAFQAGSFIVPFDLTPDKCNGIHNHNAEHGFIDLQLSFQRPLPVPIYVLYELVFPKVVINDKITNTVLSLDIDVGR